MRDALRIAAIALLVFALAGVPIFSMLVVGWLAGWWALAYLRPLIERPGGSIVLGVFAMIGVAALWTRAPEMIEAEGLSGLAPVLGDRFRAQSAPSIAPKVLFTDRPQRIWIHAPGRSQLSIALGGARSIDATPVGHGLFSALYDPRRDGSLAAASGPAIARLESSSTEAELNPTRETIAKLELDAVVPRARPRWLCSHGAQAIAVSEETDEAYLIEGTAPPEHLAVGDQPIGCAFLGTTAVVAHRSGTLAIIRDGAVETSTSSANADEHTAIATNFVAPGENAIAASGASSVIALGVRGRRTGIALSAWPSGHETKFVALPEAPDHLVYANGVLYAALRRAHAILRIDTSAASEHRTLHLGRPAIALRATRDGRHLIAPVTDHLEPDESGDNHEIRDQLLLIDTRTFRVTGTLPCEGNPNGLTATSTTTILAALTGDSRAATCATPAIETASTRSTPTPAIETASTHSTPTPNETNFVAPKNSGPTPNQSNFVAAKNSDPTPNQSSFVAPKNSDPTPNQSNFVAAKNSASTPSGMNFVASLPGVYELAELEDARGGAWVVATSPALGAIAVFDRATGEQRAFHVVADTPETDTERGELAFYEATRARISCASCHLHADSDLAHHDIGHGRASPTLTVRGVAGTSPYLRGASYPTLDSLDTFAQTILGGYDRELPNRAALLGAYVRSLPPVSPPRAFEIKSVAPGLDAFLKAGCDRCHAFPAFTNLAQVPASFLFPELGKTDRLLDTPSLLDLARTAPYLDDGRAASIEAVLVEHNRANRHGDVAALDAGERRALISFLEHL